MRCLLVSEAPLDHRSSWYRHVATSTAMDFHVRYVASDGRGHRWSLPEDDEWSAVLPVGGAPGAMPGQRDVRAAMDAVGPDVVVLTGWTNRGSVAAARWCREHRVPFGVLFDSPRLNQGVLVPQVLSRRARSVVVERAQMALPVGRQSATAAVDAGARRSVTVHANTCDSEAIAAATELATRAREPYALYVGWLTEGEGAAMLPSLADALAERGFGLRVIGDGPLRSAIEDSPAEVLGPRPAAEIFDAMAQAHVVVAPAVQDTPGIVAHEALASGTPVVATRQLDTAVALLTDFDGGMVVQPHVDDVLDACRDLVRFADARNSRSMCQQQARTITFDSAAEELQEAATSMLALAGV